MSKRYRTGSVAVRLGTGASVGSGVGVDVSRGEVGGSIHLGVGVAVGWLQLVTSQMSAAAARDHFLSMFFLLGHTAEAQMERRSPPR
jgi:hypothetical protein